MSHLRTPTAQLTLFGSRSALIPTSTLEKLNDLTILKLPQPGKAHAWFSETYGGLEILRGASASSSLLLDIRLQPQPQTGAPLLALFIYVAREPRDCQVRFACKDELLQYLKGGDPRCASVLVLVLVLVFDQASTRILRIPMTRQPFLKEWVHRKDNVISTHPIPEIREARVNSVLAASVGNIFAGALPPGIADDPALHEGAEEEIRNLGIEGPHNTSD